MTTTRALLVVLFALLCGPKSAEGQDRLAPPGGGGDGLTRTWPIDPEAAPRPVLRAERAEGRMVIDGVLSEAAWERADPATDFVQSTPNTGHPATERTEVRILYDESMLYVGAMLYDSEPDAIVAQQMVQDFYSPNEGIFGLSLDTFLDRRNAYYIMVNANGAIRD
ncbi:MAG: carbohydrate binding family 9 domain-containing protein, partial [Gemmatimonadota bacterium]|nr:carbohydrate binding family 9 domain-containing protein [Gemmatimonadota bacterium]